MWSMSGCSKDRPNVPSVRFGNESGIVEIDDEEEDASEQALQREAHRERKGRHCKSLQLARG